MGSESEWSSLILSNGPFALVSMSWKSLREHIVQPSGFLAQSGLGSILDKFLGLTFVLHKMVFYTFSFNIYYIINYINTIINYIDNILL